MSLPYRQQRRLRHIGTGLRTSDPHLTAMLLILTRLTDGERMPAGEQLGLRQGAWPRLLRLVAGLAAGGAGAVATGLRRAAAGGRRIIRRARARVIRWPAPAAGRGVRLAHRDLLRSSPDK